jgi:hypothetical protein
MGVRAAGDSVAAFSDRLARPAAQPVYVASSPSEKGDGYIPLSAL